MTLEQLCIHAIWLSWCVLAAIAAVQERRTRQ